jgi:hypothetical protein
MALEMRGVPILLRSRRSDVGSRTLLAMMMVKMDRTRQVDLVRAALRVGQ